MWISFQLSWQNTFNCQLRTSICSSCKLHLHSLTHTQTHTHMINLHAAQTRNKVFFTDHNQWFHMVLFNTIFKLDPDIFTDSDIWREGEIAHEEYCIEKPISSLHYSFLMRHWTFVITNTGGLIISVHPKGLWLTWKYLFRQYLISFSH